MNKTIKLYLIILGVVIVILTLLELNKTPVINWSYNFDTSEKSPFGLYIFDQEATAFFDNNLKKVEETPYEYLQNAPKEQCNFLVVEKEVSPDGFYKLLDRVSEGSNLFLALESIPYYVKDTLKIEETLYYEVDSDTLRIYFQDRQIEDSFALDKFTEHIDLMKDSIGAGYTPLAYQEITIYKEGEEIKDTGVNLLQRKVGKGNVFIFTQPVVFTNYYLLQKQNAKLISALFEKMPKQTTIWFQDSTAFVSYHPLRFILENKSLKHAWQMILLAIVLFVFFNAKRRQRIIPIKEEVVNKSVEFVKNIGNLYLQEGNDKDMAHKKATYFLQRVRNELYLSTDVLDNTFAKKLAIKTNQPIEEVNEAIRLIKKAIHPKAPIQQQELVELNKILDKIYK